MYIHMKQIHSQAAHLRRWSKRAPKMAPRWFQNGFKLVPREPKMAPGWLQRGLQMGPREPEMVPRWLQDGLMVGPRETKMASRWLQCGFKVSPKAPLMAPRWLHDLFDYYSIRISTSKTSIGVLVHCWPCIFPSFILYDVSQSVEFCSSCAVVCFCGSLL